MRPSFETALTKSVIAILFAAVGGSALAETPQLSMGGYARGLQRLQVMAMMDANGDHAVGREEFMKFHEALFDRMDRNHDGSIDRDEWQRRLGGIGGKGTN